MQNKKILEIQKNIFLKNYTTFKIGDKVKYFLNAKNKTEIISGIKLAKEKNLPFFILGGGSNLLVSDQGYEGLVIKLQTTNYKLQTSPKSKIQKIYVEAGTFLNQLVSFSIKNNLTGLEWAAGIPGTIGGAIRGNAGAFDGSISNIIKSVEILNTEDFKTKILKNKDCNFQYRESIFKKKQNLIILSAIFEFKKENQKNIQEKVINYLNYRKKNHPLEFPSAGSVFKGSETKIKNQKILKKFPEIKEFNKKGIIPAGFLIEKCGLKGKKIGMAQISEKHCNFIINLEKAKAKDVISLINLIKQKVKEKFRIILEEEIQFLGKF